MKTLRFHIILFLLILTNTITFCLDNKEFLYKAAFIERFTRFIDWPEKNSANIDDNFTITILGNNPISDELKKIANYQQVKNKKIVIKNVSSISPNLKTHIVFVPIEQRSELDNVIEAVRFKPVLVISEIEGAANIGVHINFFLDNNKLRFEVNERAIAESGLKISYLLLQSAKIVNHRK